MFGLKTHVYAEGMDTDKMGKFLKSFRPLIIPTGKGVVKCGDEVVGKVYKVLCSDKMANVISRYFRFNNTIENAGTLNDEPVDFTFSKDIGS